MEPLNFEHIYAGRRVAVTGHTGFTGGWLCSWLNMIGADVSGYSLPPPTNPSLYDALGLKNRLASTIGDIRDAERVNAFFAERSPEIVFHLAAQPIVSAGYDDPRGTFETNVIGTLNVLEAARHSGNTRAVVCVTTDKVYKNKEWEWGYREIDALGGTDPYSASKSAAEMVVQTYQAALAPRTNGVLIAAARGGNIIGGGDWAENRVVPDFVRAAEARKPLVLRNPSATRPWQHVMALAHAYLVLGDRLMKGESSFADAWNFGPLEDSDRSVGNLVQALQSRWPDVEVELGPKTFAESHYLHLSSEKARKRLEWTPPINFDRTMDLTVDWYRRHAAGDDARLLTDLQIQHYRGGLVV